MQYGLQTMDVSDFRIVENILGAKYCVEIIPEQILDVNSGNSGSILNLLLSLVWDTL